MRAFSVLLFLFLGLLLRTRLTVSVMLVGVCCVAVYSTVEGESSSSQLSVALLSPPVERSALLATFFFIPERASYAYVHFHRDDLMALHSSSLRKLHLPSFPTQLGTGLPNFWYLTEWHWWTFPLFCSKDNLIFPRAKVRQEERTKSQLLGEKNISRNWSQLGDYSSQKAKVL